MERRKKWQQLRRYEVQTFRTYGQENISGVEVIERVEAEVMVEVTPTGLKAWEVGKKHFFAAIEQGMEIVSANKGPFALFYEELIKKAEEKGGGLHISAATAAALPTLDVGLTSLAGSLSAEGILNGMINCIPTEMRNNGTSYANALKEAQRLGIAVTDPSYDVEGRDSANKIILIANRVFGQTLGIADVSVEGITGVTPEDIGGATKSVKVIKLIGAIERVNGELSFSVGSRALNQDHPLAFVN